MKRQAPRALQDGAADKHSETKNTVDLTTRNHRRSNGRGQGISFSTQEFGLIRIPLMKNYVRCT